MQDPQQYYNQTTLHPLGLLATVVLGLAVLLVRRERVTFALLAMACFVAPAQRIVVAGLDFSLMRLVVLFGLARVGLRREYAGLRLGPMDWCFVAWALVSATAYVLLHGTTAAIVLRLGGLYDAFGGYFLVRCVVRGWRDLDELGRGAALLSIPVAGAFLVERTTGHNLFAFLGGVPATTVVREGRLRCQGAFPHAILAGCFWAGLLPLIAARWWRPQASRALAATGIGCTLLIVVLSASSTPAAGVLACGAAAAAFLVRRRMRLLRWGALATLVGLHLVMKAPVWHLISRIDLAGGSTGWHRYHLIDASIRNFGEWWLLGTESTAHWGRLLNDVTNQYVLEGVRGGALALVLFVALISLAFGGVGRSWRAAGGRSYRTALAWGLGVSLFAHAMMFLAISISYSHQNLLVWLLVLGAVASLAPRKHHAAAATRPRTTTARRPRATRREGGVGTDPAPGAYS